MTSYDAQAELPASSQRVLTTTASRLHTMNRKKRTHFVRAPFLPLAMAARQLAVALPVGKHGVLGELGLISRTLTLEQRVR